MTKWNLNKFYWFLFRRLLRVSVWNNVLTVNNHVLGEVDIVLSQIDWSKENARDYPISCMDF